MSLKWVFYNTDYFIRLGAVLTECKVEATKEQGSCVPRAAGDGG